MRTFLDFAGSQVAAPRFYVNRIADYRRPATVVKWLAPQQTATITLQYGDPAPRQFTLVEWPLVVVAVMPEKQQLTVLIGEAELGPTAASQVSWTVPNFLTCFCIQTDYAPDISILFG